MNISINDYLVMYSEAMEDNEEQQLQGRLQGSIYDRNPPLTERYIPLRESYMLS